MPTHKLTVDEIQRKLSSAQRSFLPSEPGLEDYLKSGVFSEPPRPAAVLIPFVRVDNEWHILFTRRNSDLPEHSGQVAFPGGRADHGDASPEQTALREAYEEIGLPPESVRILGRMNSFTTISNYNVTPVVGMAPWPFPIRIAYIEVSRVFTIPWAWLVDPSSHEIKYRALPSPREPIPVVYFKPYDGEVLWGVSAYIVLNLLEILTGNSAIKRS